MLIIGITGKYCAGKTTICDYLKTKGFVSLSLSDELREIMKKKGIEQTRENMIKEGNELRKNYGNGYLAKIVLSKIGKDRNYVIDSLRNPDEIKEFKKEKNFRLWNIKAKEQNRFERII
ncbi:MAG: AAA family ATPase, partial [Candidatus Diapherotrites archaeon]